MIRRTLSGVDDVCHSCSACAVAHQQHPSIHGPAAMHILPHASRNGGVMAVLHADVSGLLCLLA